MTLPSSAVRIGKRLPSAQEKAAANQLRQVIAKQASGEVEISVVTDGGKPVGVTLTPGLSDILMELLRHIGSGDAVTILPVNQMLTTKQAADILNVSRPFLVGLIDKGEIPHTLVGRHRRVKADDLFAYKNSRAATRSSALEELAEIDAELI
ncbi:MULTISPECIES: helix-turn-helix domain-containing protein [unclassified Methylobacterium]|uniref:helix-turn-helix domain-containing protein n=1 Tax=unclassified Methylobacterium TaxID=2615210 RepID=UPI0006F257AB|nr:MULTISPECIES: helix-turn-helix domain-containing protein [unclassified Methylobacterium]KQO53603.1 excisionase [Methylobacterium sp. Leaf86]KQO99123.1 excisionase [Methylobacterium sp. Leaf91]